MRSWSGFKNSRFLSCLLFYFFVISILPSATSAVYLNDFLVNSESQEFNDDFPSVLIDANGNFNVIWTKFRYYQGEYTFGKAFIKRFDSNGNVLLQATPLTPDSMLLLSPAPVSFLPNGNLIVTWADYTTQFEFYIHSYGQIYGPTGTPLTAPFKIDYLTADNVNSFVSDVGIDSSGNIIILWRDSSNGNIYYQRFTEQGVALDTPARADTCIEVECSDSRDTYMAVHPDGHFVIVWYDNVVEYNTYIPVARLYDTAAHPVWPGAKLLTCDGSSFSYVLSGSQGNCMAGGWTDIAMNQSGSFMIFIGAAAGEPNSNSIYGRLFDSTGIALTNNLKINTVNPKTYDLYPRASPDPQGGYYVMWTECRHSTNEGLRDVFLQRFDNLSNPIGDNWRVNTPRGSGKYNWISYDVAISGDRAFILWKDYRDWVTYPSYNDTLLTNIYGQVVDVSQIGFYIAGDANFDGGISLADVIHLVNYILKHSTPPDPELWIGDVNADCKVTLADVIYLVNYVFKPGWPPPAQGCAE